MGYLEKIEDPRLRDGHAGGSEWARHNVNIYLSALISIRARVELATLEP